MKRKRAIRLLTLALAFGGLGEGADKRKTEFCAVQVEAVSRSGVKVRQIPVELLNERGEVVAETKMRDGIARFCDFGFGEHSILVNRRGCPAIEIHNVYISFGQEHSFKVALEGCAPFFTTTACPLELRVQTTSGTPIAGATIRSLVGRNLSYYNADRTDKYGRVLLYVDPGTEEGFPISAPGYRAETIGMSCPTMRNLRHIVVLKTGEVGE
jgi:hypothetical protein